MQCCAQVEYHLVGLIILCDIRYPDSLAPSPFFLPFFLPFFFLFGKLMNRCVTCKTYITLKISPPLFDSYSTQSLIIEPSFPQVASCDGSARYCCNRDVTNVFPSRHISKTDLSGFEESGAVAVIEVRATGSNVSIRVITEQRRYVHREGWATAEDAKDEARDCGGKCRQRRYQQGSQPCTIAQNNIVRHINRCGGVRKDSLLPIMSLAEHSLS